MNTRSLIRATARQVLDDALNSIDLARRADDMEDTLQPWSVQGLGMLRIYLTPEIRLHVWDQSLRVPNVSDIHDHPWDFRSYVVSGELANARFYEFMNGMTSDEALAHTRARDGFEARRVRIRCGPGAHVVEPAAEVTLYPRSMLCHRSGEWYEQSAYEIHKTIPARDGTVTLVERVFRADTEHARVYYTTPEWVDAKPRPATQAEVESVIGRALERW